MYHAKSRIVAAIFKLLSERAHGATICPSEVARALQTEGWRVLMQPVREVAAELAAAGQLVILQRRQVIQLTEDTRGPVRLGLPT